jgi:hypothetical protein
MTKRHEIPVLELGLYHQVSSSMMLTKEHSNKAFEDEDPSPPWQVTSAIHFDNCKCQETGESARERASHVEEGNASLKLRRGIPLRDQVDLVKISIWRIIEGRV